MAHLTSYVAVEKRLMTDPELRHMARAMQEAGLAPNIPSAICMALGGLTQFWAQADDHADSDAVMLVDRADWSERLGFDLIGFMPPNWLREIGPGRYQLPDFWDKNGRAGKARLQAATRKRESRARTSRNVEPPPRDTPSQKKMTTIRDTLSQKNVTSEQSEQTEQAEQATQASGKPASDRDSRDALSVTELAQGERFISLYPKHAGALERERVLMACARVVRQRLTRWPELIAAAGRYDEYVKGTGREGTQFIKSPLKFIEDALYREAWEVPISQASQGSASDDCEGVRRLIGAGAS